MLIFASTAFAVFASESWHMQVRSPALRKQVGNRAIAKEVIQYANY